MSEPAVLPLPAVPVKQPPGTVRLFTPSPDESVPDTNSASFLTDIYIFLSEYEYVVLSIFSA